MHEPILYRPGEQAPVDGNGDGLPDPLIRELAFLVEVQEAGRPEFNDLHIGEVSLQELPVWRHEVGIEAAAAVEPAGSKGGHGRRRVIDDVELNAVQERELPARFVALEIVVVPHHGEPAVDHKGIELKGPGSHRVRLPRLHVPNVLWIHQEVWRRQAREERRAGLLQRHLYRELVRGGNARHPAHELGVPRPKLGAWLPGRIQIVRGVF